ncbi:MAG: mobile mystery protein A [Leptospirales bacterium]|nr:mobile mystery protein A [Leptospirales bacterium]
MNKKHLLLEQLDNRTKTLSPIPDKVPQGGWVHTIRITLGMSLSQLAKRLKITAQSAKEIEEREARGAITLKLLRDVADSMDLRLVYALIPRTSTFEALIEKRATEIATEIVLRTSRSMALEAQENEPARLKRAIRQRAKAIAAERPKYLWD